MRTFYIVSMVFVIVGTACAANPPKTIEEAILASGGTVAVMDTSDPDSAGSAVQAIMDHGLTASDDRGQGRERSYPGLKFRGRLAHDHDVQAITYQGKRGERLHVTVTSSEFVPEIRGFLDANGAWGTMDSYSENGPVAEAVLNCRYTGEYEFKVTSRGFNSTGFGAFTLTIKSDKSALVPEEKGVSLVAGGTYTVRELKKNRENKETEVVLDAYCVFLKENICPPCLPTHMCKECAPPYNIGFADDPRPRNGYDEFQVDDAVIIDSIHDTEVFARFKVGEKYRFKVRVQNSSRTDVPDNFIRFLSFEE